MRSHPAFALPLRRLGIPATALAIGSLTPDVPLWADAAGIGGLFHTLGLTYSFTHSSLGVLTACLVFGVVLWAWWIVLRAPLYDALPAMLRAGRPFRPLSLGKARAALLAGLGLWIGAASHVVIDEFTHEGRWAHTVIAWFAEEHYGLAGVKWAQYTGSILGALVVAAYVLGWLVQRVRTGVQPQNPAGVTGRLLMWAALIGAVVVAAGSVIIPAAAISLEYAVFQALTTGVLIVAAGATVGALGWHSLARVSAQSRGSLSGEHVRSRRR